MDGHQFRRWRGHEIKLSSMEGGAAECFIWPSVMWAKLCRCLRSTQTNEVVTAKDVYMRGQHQHQTTEEVGAGRFEQKPLQRYLYGCSESRRYCLIGHQIYFFQTGRYIARRMTSQTNKSSYVKAADGLTFMGVGTQWQPDLTVFCSRTNEHAKSQKQEWNQPNT